MTHIRLDWTKPVEYSRKNGEWEDVTVIYQDTKGVYVEFKTGTRAHYSLGEDFHPGWWRNKKESRAVPRDKWLDLTKPLEAINTETGKPDLSAVVYVGPIADNSRNFPSWFVCKWDSDSARKLGFVGIEEDSYFLMRGDGKTDIPGLTVRNKVSKPKLTFPLSLGKRYRCRNGDVLWLMSGYEPGKLNWNYLSDYNPDTGTCCGGDSKWDIVEGPL